MERRKPQIAKNDKAMTKYKKYLRQTKGIIYANTMSQASAKQTFGECENKIQGSIKYEAI